MEWVKLGDIASLITKGTTPTTLGFDFVDEGINFVKIESITEDGRFVSDKFNHIMMFPAPDDNRLEAFLSFIKQTDKSKLAIQQSITQLETLKKSLMQKYFG